MKPFEGLKLDHDQGEDDTLTQPRETVEQDVPPPAAKPKRERTWGEFFDEEIWPNRPRRDGSDSMAAGRSAFVAVMKNNHHRDVTPELLRDKHQEYKRWCEAKGKIGTEGVMQVASFFGPKKEGWRQEWEVQAPTADLARASPAMPKAFASIADWVNRKEGNAS